jgi:GMP synthase-like glutamine amidotransferase
MRAHCLQHVPFEDMAAITEWLSNKKFEITYTKFFNEIALPDPSDIDWLIIMGGPMSVNEEKNYPWLKIEKQFINDCIAQNKVIIGICLGSQLIANSLGYKVYPNKHKEIGWFPINKNKNINIEIFDDLPEELPVFHWHGETFDLPEESVLIASSEACTNQIFCVYPNIIGFQCHLETNSESLAELSSESEPELKIPGKYLQTADEMVSGSKFYTQPMHSALFGILDKLLLTNQEFMQ